MYFVLSSSPKSTHTECKEVLESSAAVLQTSQQLIRSMEQVMADAIIKHAALHRSVNEGLSKKIAETQNLQVRWEL